MSLFDEVKEIIASNLDNYYNPSSSYSKGQLLDAKINEARLTIAKTLNANANNVIFTSGASEANNLAIFGHKNIKSSNYAIAYLGFDHNSITKPLKYLKKQGHPLIKLNFSNFINDLDASIEVLREKKVQFLSLSHVYANIGIKLDIEKIAKKIKKELPRVYIHIDAAQSYMKEDLKIDYIDSISISAHKIGGLKGVGALILKNKQSISSVIMGGKQNFSLRSGTENIIGILSLEKAVKVWSEYKDEFRNSLLELNKYFKEQFNIFFNNNENIKIITPLDNNYADNIIAIAIKNVLSEHIIRFLDEKEIFISASSTCSDKSYKPPFLNVVKLSQEFEKGIIRVSFSPYSKKSEIDDFLDGFKEAILYFF